MPRESGASTVLLVKVDHGGRVRHRARRSRRTAARRAAPGLDRLRALPPWPTVIDGSCRSPGCVFPIGFIANHGIEGDQHFAHHGGQRDLARTAILLDEPMEKRAHDRIEADGATGAVEKHFANFRTAVSSAGMAASLTRNIAARASATFSSRNARSMRARKVTDSRSSAPWRVRMAIRPGRRIISRSTPSGTSAVTARCPA